MGHRSHHLCWLSRLLCCWRTAFSWCCLAYPWRWDRCLCLPVDNQGCAGGGKTQGNKFGCWARALCLWLTFRVLTDRQTDRQTESIWVPVLFVCFSSAPGESWAVGAFLCCSEFSVSLCVVQTVSSNSPWTAFGFIAAIKREHRGGSSCAVRLFRRQGYRIHVVLF